MNIENEINYELNYEGLGELIQALQKRRNELYPEYRDRRNQEYHNNQKIRAAKEKEFKQNVLPKIKNWVLKNLKENDVIKVKGARDGKGIRIFLRFVNDKLECRQIHHDWYGSKIGYKDSLGQITEHMIDKLTHVKIGDNFVKITELIE